MRAQYASTVTIRALQYNVQSLYLSVWIYRWLKLNSLLVAESAPLMAPCDVTGFSSAVQVLLFLILVFHRED